MKNRRAKGGAKSTSTAQLDLFSRPMAGSAGSQVVEAIEPRRQHQSTIVVEALPAPARDPLLDYVVGARGCGRPEKLLTIANVGAVDQRRLLDVREAAQRLGLSKSTLDKMRCSGRGPRFIRASDRAIRYDPADLQAFAEERRRRSTSDLVGVSAG